jgi:hypothetical protein
MWQIIYFLLLLHYFFLLKNSTIMVIIWCQDFYCVLLLIDIIASLMYVNIVKNQFGIQDVYLQVLLTRLTPVVKTRLFLKPSDSDKNRLAAFCS